MKVAFMVLVLVAVLGGGIYLFSQDGDGGGEVQNVSVKREQASGQEFYERFKATENAVLLDVRTPQEYQTSHIKDAVNVDYESPGFRSALSGLDRNRTYFVYCRSGNRSGKAIDIMVSEGFNDIVELKGGIVASPELLSN